MTEVWDTEPLKISSNLHIHIAKLTDEDFLVNVRDLGKQLTVAYFCSDLSLEQIQFLFQVKHIYRIAEYSKSYPEDRICFPKSSRPF